MSKDVSSLRKKRRTESSEEGSLLSSRSQQLGTLSVMLVDDGTENSVMDFSVGSNDVFLPVALTDVLSARVQRPKTKEVRSPEFKSRSSARTERGLWQHQPSFGEGSSQGFDISVTDGSNCSPPSPVFSGPVSLLRNSHHNEVAAFSQCTGTTDKGDAEPRPKRRRLSSGNASKTKGSGDRCGGENKKKEALVEPSSRKLTPLQIKGNQTNMKFSPGVSTSSLVHLMNSPILFGSQDKQERSMDAIGLHISKRSTSRKALQL